MRSLVMLITICGLLAPVRSVRAELPELIGEFRSDTNLTLFGTRIIPLGDQNDDGFDDILTWSFRRTAYLYYGGDPPDTAYALRFDSVGNRFNNVGDINGDGFPEFTISKRLPVPRKLSLFYGGPSTDTVRDLWFGDDTLYAIGYTARGYDLNANGTDDLISWSNSHGSVILFELGPSPDTVPDLEISPPNLTKGLDYVTFGEGIIAGDFNGDDTCDLAVNFRPRENANQNGSVYLYWGGSDFDTIPDLIITRPGEYEWGFHKFGTILEYLGDISGDGYVDFFAGSGPSYYDTVGFIFFGGPDIDTIADVVIDDDIIKARLAGDVNNDGYNDLITSCPLPWSSMGHVNIYFGGPDMDSIPDVHIHNRDMPEYQLEFGMDCSGAGDVNGDGIDDFAFSAVLSPSMGVVYIFAGWNSGTDVEYEYEPAVPEDFELSQNYPNPFNLETTISFKIPYKSKVELVIYNILGEEVRTLISRQLAAGSYRVSWDGRDKEGKTAPSGVYIYELKAEGIGLSKKMLLLK